MRPRDLYDVVNLYRHNHCDGETKRNRLTFIKLLNDAVRSCD